MLKKCIPARFLPFFLPLLVACERVLPLELPEPEARIVLNSMFNPDSLWQVELTASQGIGASRPYNQVEDAEVNLYLDNSLLEKLKHEGRGIYRSKTARPAPNVSYRLVVSAPGFPAVESIGHAPEKPATSGLQARIIPSPDNPGGNAVSVRLQLTDPPQRANYYYVRAYSHATGADGKAFLEPVALSATGKLFEFSMGSRWFFSDKLFDGKTYSLDMYYNTYPGQLVQLEIAHLSEDYYLYSRTLNKQTYRDNLLSMPVGVYGNIRNGFGIMAGYHVHTYQLKTKE